MRVLLISPNMEKLPDPVAPLGLAYLSAILRSQGHEVQVLDLCFAADLEKALQGAIGNFTPEVMGLSLRNIDNVAFPETVSYLPFYKEVVELCRKLSPAPVFLGGSAFTIMPRPILRYLKTAGGIAGEGENALAHLLQVLTTGGDGSSAMMDQVDGFVSPSSEKPVRAACLRDLDTLPLPDWDRLDLAEYFRRGGMGNLQTKRGCPFECIYCTYPLIEGKSVRLRSPEKVAAEAEELVERGIGNAFIVDNIFNYPEIHARGICRIFTEKRIPLQWSCYAHPRYFSRALADDMKRAGCTGVEFGTDSGSARVLSRLGKSFTLTEIRQATRWALEAGLEVCHSLCLGAPGETEETLKETFALMEEISPTAVIAMVGLRVFPGTGLARLAQEESLIKPDHDFLEPTFYIDSGVRERVVELARGKAAEHAHWIFPGMGINVSAHLQAKLRRIGVKGPLWEHMKILRGRKPVRKEPHV